MKTVFDLQIGKPSIMDGTEIWKLVKAAGTLDLNSSYCYIMLCDLFRETCAVAKHGSEVVGFLSACRKPENPDTLFVWQVAVARELRGKGIGSGMLRELLNRRGLEDIRYVEATIGPENMQSKALFTGLAARRGCQCVIAERYPAEMFPQENGCSHEPEYMYRIGPLRKKERVLAHS